MHKLLADIPVLQQSDWSSFRPGLERVRSALDLIGQPQKRFFSILVGGTNGKGTVAWNLARNFGPNTGLFMSPHVSDIRERITKAGDYIADDLWLAAYRHCRSLGLKDSDLSYFEWLFVMALWIFQSLGLRHAVFEVGLGGRLDATNVIDADISVLTNVGLDHQEYLGHSIEEIALEKVEIRRPGRPFFMPQSLAHLPKVTRQLSLQPSQVHYHSGAEQLTSNRELVAQVLKHERKKLVSWDLPRGRRQKIAWNGDVWLDGAHNQMAWRDLAGWIKAAGIQPHICLGLSGQRDPSDAVQLLTPVSATVSVLDIEFDGAIAAESWSPHLPRVQLSCLREGPRPLLITGSLRLVGAVLNQLNGVFR